MKVNQVVELEDGTLDLKANLSEDELQMVVEVGLNVLMAHGSIPFLNEKSVEAHQIQAGTTTPQ
jgi:hypothetical protein